MKSLIRNWVRLINGCVLINFLLIIQKKFSFNKTLKNCELRIYINGFLIKQSDSTKYLGLVLDDKLNWKKHLTSLKSKVSRSYFVMSKLRYYLDVSTVEMV